MLQSFHCNFDETLFLATTGILIAGLIPVYTHCVYRITSDKPFSTMALHSVAVSSQKGHTQVTCAMIGDLPHTPIIQHCVTRLDLCIFIHAI